MHKNVKWIKEALQNGADINYNKSEAMYVAIGMDYGGAWSSIIDILIEKGSNVIKNCNEVEEIDTPTCLHCLKNKIDVFSYYSFSECYDCSLLQGHIRRYVASDKILKNEINRRGVLALNLPNDISIEIFRYLNYSTSYDKYIKTGNHDSDDDY